jgi:hypothetical protein
MPTINLPAIYTIAAIAAVLYGLRSRIARSKLPLPPGPPKLPLVGNLFSLPSSFEWETYLAWSRLYSQCLTSNRIFPTDEYFQILMLST